MSHFRRTVFETAVVGLVLRLIDIHPILWGVYWTLAVFIALAAASEDRKK